VCLHSLKNFIPKFEIDIEQHKKSNMNSVAKDKSTNDTIHISLYLFFSPCVLNLVMQILRAVNIHLVCSHNYFFKKIETCNFKF
jgi:hypothetical protein